MLPLGPPKLRGTGFGHGAVQRTIVPCSAPGVPPQLPFDAPFPGRTPDQPRNRPPTPARQQAPDPHKATSVGRSGERRRRFGEEFVGDRAEIRVEVAAEHVAQEGPQML
jgi:hypothetical protein